MLGQRQIAGSFAVAETLVDNPVVESLAGGMTVGQIPAERFSGKCQNLV